MSLPIGIRCMCYLRQFRQARLFGHQIFILLLTFFIYASYHLSRKPISVVKNALRGNSSCNENYTLSNCTDVGWSPFNGTNADGLLGALDLAYLFSYAVGMFFSGHIAERCNMRHFLVFGMAASGLMTILFGCGRLWNIHSFAYYVIIQVICGLVQSTGWPPVVAIVANWFGKGGRGIIFGIWNIHTYVGNIFGSLIAGAVLQHYGDDNWALAFIIPGIIIIALAGVTLMFLVPHPNDLASYLEISECNQRRVSESEDSNEVIEDSETSALVQTESMPRESSETAISFIRALRIPGVIEFSFCLFFAKLVSYTFLYWLPQYIAISEHASSYLSAELSTMFDVGGMIGGILAGILSDILDARAVTCIFMLALAAPAMFAYEAWGAISIGASILLLIISGILVNGPYSLITTAVSADLGQSLHGNAKALATVSAIIDGTGSIGAAIGPLLAGVISPTGWENVFYTLIAADLAAMVLLLRLGAKEVKNISGRCCRRTSELQFGSRL